MQSSESGWTKDPVSIVIFILIVCYLSALLLVARRLEKKHPDAWESVGRFSLLNWSISSSFKMFGFVAFSGAHGQLNDRPLSLGIHVTRLVIVVLTILIAGWSLNFWGDSRS